MQKEFESNINKKQLFNRKKTLLLALSGGVDSVVLAHLLKAGKYDFTLAHCNFKLRGKESDSDEKFCIALAKKLGIKIHTIQFDVKKYCKTHKVSVQMAARTLRYSWFFELIEKEKFEHLITAHHADDLIETVLINLLRGTGIKGLHGIREKSDIAIRPLLPFSKQEIISFAKTKKIKFRLDKSNLEDKYERNYLRLKVIPLLKKLNNSLETTFLENSFRFRQEAGIVKDHLMESGLRLVKNRNGSVSIDKNKLKFEKHKETLLHFLLSPYGFTKTQQQNILNNIAHDKDPGKVFTSGKFKLNIERNELIISENTNKKTEEIKISSLNEFKKQSLFKITNETHFTSPKKNELLIDEARLIFPLKVRATQTGDRFKPFGMKGSKLLSDFFKDEKLNTGDRNEVKLLINGNGEIIWVIDYRSDERYRVDPKKKQFLKILALE